MSAVKRAVPSYYGATGYLMVKASDFDSVATDNEQLRKLLTEVGPHLCIRRDEQDRDFREQLALAEKLDELIRRIEAAVSVPGGAQ